MNYIKHLTEIFQRFDQDPKLNPTHISLYFALFYYWNWNRFPEKFFVHREELMQLSKIGSTATYHKCLKNLNDWNYLEYLPSYNPFKGSEIKMFIFQTSCEQALKESETSGKQDLKKSETSAEKALASYINSNKRDKRDKHDKHDKLLKPKNKKELIDFFKNNQWPEKEALKFYLHYEAMGWKIGGASIENWQALAERWMLICRENKKNKYPASQDNLKTSKIKNYGEPL